MTYYKVYEIKTGAEHALYTNAINAATVAKFLNAFYLSLRYSVVTCVSK